MLFEYRTYRILAIIGMIIFLAFFVLPIICVDYPLHPIRIFAATWGAAIGFGGLGIFVIGVHGMLEG